MVVAHPLESADERRAGFRVIRDEDRPEYDDGGAQQTLQGFTRVPELVRAMKDGYAVAVFEAIARRACDGIAWPSVALICEDTGWSKKIVAPAIERLIAAGALSKERRFANGMKRSNQYRLTAYERMVPKVPTLAPTEPLDGSHGSIGWHPGNHEQEPIEQEPIEQEGATPPVVPQAEKPKPQRSVKTAVPDDLESLIPFEVWSKIGFEQRMSDDDLRRETENLIDHFRGKGERMVDWVAVWRKWMRSPYRKPAASSGRASPNGLPTAEDFFRRAAELERQGR